MRSNGQCLHPQPQPRPPSRSICRANVASFTVYDYRTTKARAGPAEILKTYKGGVVADAFRLEVRQRESVPQLASLKQWLDEVTPGLLPKSPIRLGFAYIQRHWEALNRYTNVGYLAIDNNAAERGFRPIGIGRRNWLFAGSDAGGRTAAVLYSLTQTCREHKLDPWTYLKQTLTKLPTTPKDKIASLVPTA